MFVDKIKMLWNRLFQRKPPTFKRKNESSVQFRKMLIILMMILNSIIVFTPILNIVGASQYEIDGNTVFINDSKVYISCTPHTIIESSPIIINFTSKVYTGDIDFCFGFNNTYMNPSNPQRWNGTEWVDWNGNWETISYDFMNMTTWKYMKDVSIVEDVKYSVKCWMNMKFNTTGKYFLALKPSSETIHESISNGHFYYLDPWWNGSWNYYRTITISNTYIEDTLTNFPVLVAVNSTVSALCNGGNSVRFVSTDNITMYKFEREGLWNSSGTNYYWVNITTVKSGSDTKFLMYYGNPSSPDGQNKEAVWDSGFLMVHHMTGLFVSPLEDSTSNNNDINEDGGNPAYNQPGLVEKCIDFDGDDWCNVTAGDFDFNNSFTIEFWVDVGASQGDYECAMTTANDGAPEDGWFIELGKARNNLMYDGYHGLNVVTRNNKAISSGFHYVTIFRNNNNGTRWYYDSVNTTGTPTSFVGQIGNDSYNLGLGKSNWASTSWDLSGSLDEIRFSSVARNASWIKATYNTTKQTAGFLTWSEQHNLTTMEITSYNYTDGTTNVPVDPTITLDVTVAHANGSNMDITWYSNSSGSWVAFGTNNTVNNGTYEQSNSNFSNNLTTYYWNVSISDGWVALNSAVHYFTTGASNIPDNPTNVDTIFYSGGYLNITWTMVGNADATTVVRKNASYPASETDGWEIYNGSNEYFNHSGVTSTCYFRLYSYNATGGGNFSTGVNAPWGGLGVNVFDEDNETALTFDLEITNEDATQTYYATGLTNTHYVDLDNIPYGDNTIFIVNSDIWGGYKQRISYFDLVANTFYNYSFYLSLNRSTVHEYYFRVVDPTDQPIDGAVANISVRVGSVYKRIAQIITNANGYGHLELNSSKTYQVTLTKSGFDTETEKWNPDPVFYGQYYPEVYKMNYLGTSTNFTGFWNNVTFTGLMFINGSIRIIFDDFLSSTTNSQLLIYEIYNNTKTYMASYNTTSTTSFIWWDAGYNVTRTYLALLWLNTTVEYDVGFPVSRTIYPANITERYRTVDLESRFVGLFGPSPNNIGWCNMISIILALVLLGSFGIANVGAGIVASGVGLFGTQIIFTANGVAWNAQLSFAAVFIIFIGFVYFWATSREGENL